MDANVFRVNAAGAPRDAKAVTELINSAREAGHFLDLGELWAALHFTMTAELPIPKEEAKRRGVEWFDGSLENVLLGGETLPLRTGFGPARYIEPAEVKTLAGALEQLSPEELATDFDAEALDEERIPPGGWSDEDGERVSELYGKLRALYKAAAEAQQAVVVAID